MLLLQKPTCINDYTAIKNKQLNLFLQKEGLHPMYLWDGFYYYKTNKLLENAINKYKTMQYESEVSKFGKGL